MKIIYVCGPYIGDGTFKSIERNIRTAERYAVDLINCGIACITPHLNTAHFGDKSSRTEEFYRAMYIEIVGRCDGLACIPGWQSSGGSRLEIERANQLKKPIFYLPADWAKINKWYRNL